MKTIQISTTNLIHYMCQHPEYKAKLCEEILPPIEKVKDNIIEDFDYDTVMEYDYLVKCYMESLRICPPASNTVTLTMSEDCTINVRGK
jgi:cytochrome P450